MECRRLLPQLTIRGREHYSVVLLAGPSASGKTTTAYKLREQMREIGTGAHVVSLDNFYKNHDFYPRAGGRLY